jgi:hypothetical protein
MAPVVRLEPNGCQALLSHDDAIEDLKSHGWDVFLKIFEGYNLQVAKDFAQTFDGCREKIGDTQLELTEGFVSEAIGLPSKGEKWFKNARIEGVPWSLFMTSRKINCCEKGISISLVKPRWHSLLLILKQFVTCEGRYRLVFLYHIRLLMHFIGFELDMPFYLLRSLYKMSKRYKRQSVDSSLFHHGLVKILLMHHLSTVGDCWENFLIRNGFSQTVPTVNPNLDEPLIKDQFGISIDRPDFTDRNPLDAGMPSKSSPTGFSEQETVELKVIDPLVPEIDASLNVIINPDVEKPRKGTKKKCTDLGFKNKRAGRQISRKLRNRSDTHLSSIGLIKIDECSDPEIEDFLVLEDPEFQGYRKKVIVPTEPYDFVTNFPPCLKGKEGFSGIRPDQKKIAGKIDTPLFDCALHRPAISPVQCDVCFHWIERYYTDIPVLQARIKSLTAQNDLLRQENRDLKVHTQRGKLNVSRDQET